MKSLLLTFLLFYSSFVFAQTEKEKIQWDKNRPLTWNDFRGKPSPSKDYKASTNSGMSISWSLSETGNKVALVDYEVKANFYPDQSWKKEDIRKKDYILAHEQLHFDISELHARKLRKALAEYKDGKNVEKELTAIYRKFENERRKMQSDFDAESVHSQIEEEELKWREYVKQQLEQYKAYAE
ncbi:DUF922 domain-containing protein [Salegentibacter sp. F188]|uniref:DUF922 domain-containing protein n=1 Tax=Autumnicola patrickiae TaxID=3075591 RepID=A0ABU3DXG7_9FLAO|nr:DUF922 domain-containing protein [Salegentibacter sp. F188]MDT0688417.1 DUF922 domain-containing protein [Salegentibacter sp. F188]